MIVCAVMAEAAQDCTSETANVSAYGAHPTDGRMRSAPYSVDSPPQGGRATRDGRLGLVASSRAPTAVQTQQCQFAATRRNACNLLEYEQHTEQ